MGLLSGCGCERGVAQKEHCRAFFECFRQGKTAKSDRNLDNSRNLRQGVRQGEEQAIEGPKIVLTFAMSKDKSIFEILEQRTPLEG